MLHISAMGNFDVTACQINGLGDFQAVSSYWLRGCLYTAKHLAVEPVRHPAVAVSTVAAQEFFGASLAAILL